MGSKDMLIVAGLGPGSLEYTTDIVLKEIKTAKNILAFGRVGESIKSLREDYVVVNRVDQIVEFIDTKEDVLVLASGDPLFFGIVDYLKKKDIKVDLILPGLSSFQYMMSKLQMSWHEASFVSFHGRELDFSSFKENKLIIALVDKKNNPDFISQELYKIGIRGNMHIGFNLSYMDEKICKIRIGDNVDMYSNLAVVVIENEMDC
jgi:cobalt-precorrin-7 (C5)-methyltransferase